MEILAGQNQNTETDVKRSILNKFELFGGKKMSKMFSLDKSGRDIPSLDLQVELQQNVALGHFQLFLPLKIKIKE